MTCDRSTVGCAPGLGRRHDVDRRHHSRIAVQDHFATSVRLFLPALGLLTGFAATGQERAVRDVTPLGVVRVYRSAIAIPEPVPTPADQKLTRILDNVRV